MSFLIGSGSVRAAAGTGSGRITDRETDVAVLIVLNKLKAGADRAAYEKWAAEVDRPTVMDSFASVDDWHLHRATANLGGGDLPFDYVEVVTINDPEQLGRDVQSETAGRLSSELADFCEPPTFILADQVV